MRDHGEADPIAFSRPYFGPEEAEAAAAAVAKRVKLREMEREVATAEHEIPEPK